MTALPDPTPDPPWSSAQRARLVRLCTAVVGDAVAAEDLAQETMLEAWRLRDRLVDASGTDAWLNAIARNVCRRWLRERGADPSHPTDVVPERAAHQLDDALEREDVVDLLERALALLPRASGAALVGHYVEQQTHAEIAERLGTSVDAVSMRVSRGRQRLRELLETDLADDSEAMDWVRRGSGGWRRTRLACPDCGRAGTEMRRDDLEVAFRCRWCDPEGLSSRLALDAPAYARLVGDVRRPSAVQARLAAWTRSYWSSPATRCVRCDRAVTPRRIVREEREPWAIRHGWMAACDACGETVSSSVAGLVLALPAVRAARAREPRLRAMPVRDVVRDGQPAKVVALGDAGGRPRVAAVVVESSLEIVHVDTSTG